MTGTSMIGSPFQERLRTSSKWLFWVGLAMAALGILFREKAKLDAGPED